MNVEARRWFCYRDRSTAFEVFERLKAAPLAGPGTLELRRGRTLPNQWWIVCTNIVIGGGYQLNDVFHLSSPDESDSWFPYQGQDALNHRQNESDPIESIRVEPSVQGLLVSAAAMGDDYYACRPDVSCRNEAGRRLESFFQVRLRSVSGGSESDAKAALERELPNGSRVVGIAPTGSGRSGTMRRLGWTEEESQFDARRSLPQGAEIVMQETRPYRSAEQESGDVTHRWTVEISAPDEETAAERASPRSNKNVRIASTERLQDPKEIPPSLAQRLLRKLGFRQDDRPKIADGRWRFTLERKWETAITYREPPTTYLAAVT